MNKVFQKYIYHFKLEVNNGVKINDIENKFDNKVIQAGEIYWETKLTIESFGSNEPSSGLGGLILVILNQQ